MRGATVQSWVVGSTGVGPGPRAEAGDGVLGQVGLRSARWRWGRRLQHGWLLPPLSPSCVL